MSIPQLKPMLPQLTQEPFDHPDWTFEPKHDGYRMLITREGERVTIRSRKGLDNTSEYPWLVDLVRKLNYDEILLDGEIVAQDAEGRESFNLLQNRLSLRPRLQYVAFDLLYLDGLDVWKMPLNTRREGLTRVLPDLGPLRCGDSVRTQGKLFFEACLEAGYEGVVAKRDCPYEPGRRSPNWLKFKRGARDEFVIGGYTPGTGHRSNTFGALILGYYPAGELDEMFPCLQYVGNVGTGFDDATLARLLPILRARHQPASPFSKLGPQPTAGPRAPGPIQWLTPNLVADVAYQERTSEGILRFPSFKGLREDKDPEEAGQGT